MGKEYFHSLHFEYFQEQELVYFRKEHVMKFQYFEYLVQTKMLRNLIIQIQKYFVLTYFRLLVEYFQKNRECQNPEQTYTQITKTNNYVTIVIIAYFLWTCKYFEHFLKRGKRAFFIDTTLFFCWHY